MKFKIVTLGCKVNAYESNYIRDIFLNENFIEDEENPDVVVINTCTVTDTSDSKSLKVIRSNMRNHENSIFVVMGCYAQINYNVLKDMNVNIIIGNHNKTKVLEYLKEYLKNRKQIIDIQDMNKVPFDEMILNNFNKTRAFVKIEDGCENFCSYCIIPYTRGKVRSKRVGDVISEITNLVNNGHKEIVLTGIHTGHYGDGEVTFSTLLERICKIDGLERIRISSIEITELDDKFLEVLKNNPKIVDHIHIPVQSGSDEILKSMNRKYDKEYFINEIEKIRSIRPSISITTDLIVGFPGETEELFNETIDTINKIRFSKIHVFPYSRRKNTPADTFENQIPENIKHERVRKIIDLSKKLEIEYMSKFLGQELSFIPEMKKEEFLVGHTKNYISIKYKTDKKLTHDEITVKLDSIEYPYVIAK